MPYAHSLSAQLQRAVLASCHVACRQGPELGCCCRQGIIRATPLRVSLMALGSAAVAVQHSCERACGCWLLVHCCRSPGPAVLRHGVCKDGMHVMPLYQ